MSTTQPKGARASTPPANDTADDDAGPVPTSEHESLPAALMQAQRLIAHGVRKSGEAKVETRTGGSYSYKFASGEDMFAGAREVLLAVGLLWTLEAYEVIELQDLSVYAPTFLLEHPASGAVAGAAEGQPQPRRYRFPIPICMSGAADKALAGARTYASSYALRDVLLIPRPDANEPDKRRNDDGAGSWRTQASSRKVTPAGESEPTKADGVEAGKRPSAHEIAYGEVTTAWREYQAAQRARGVEPDFKALWREASGKVWPGKASGVAAGELVKAAAEIKRLTRLVDEADKGTAPSSGPADAEGDYAPGEGELFGDTPGDHS